MRNPRYHRRARGNLSYLEFIRLVEFIWLQSHPDIPFEPAGNELPAKYPSIIYAMQLSKTHPNEPKPHFREMMDNDEDDNMMMIAGQRFQNVVTFSAVAEKNPHLAEELIEVFEDFMLEFTPVFKQQGLSEIVYARRMPDREETRPGEGVIWRTTSYMVTTEKVIYTPYEKLRKIDLDVRRNFAQPDLFFLSNSDDTLDVFGQEFSIGDKVAIKYRPGTMEAAELIPAIYMISSISVTGENRRYYLAKLNGQQVEFPPGIFGYIELVEDDVTTDIHDQFSHDTPDQDF